MSSFSDNKGLSDENVRILGEKISNFFYLYGVFAPGMWKRKHFEERSWKQTRKHLTFWGAGSGSIFHKTWCFHF